MRQRRLILCISLFMITIRLIINTIIVNHMRPTYQITYQKWLGDDVEIDTHTVLQTYRLEKDVAVHHQITIEFVE